MRSSTGRRPLILVIGSLNYDFILTHERLPEAGETIVGASLVEACGGKGANQAIAASRCARTVLRQPLDVVFAGAVGDDELGRRQVEQLRADGIDTSAVRVYGDEPTGVSTIWVDAASGENRILNAPGANWRLAPADLDRLPWGEAAWVLCQNELPASILRHVAERVAATGGRLIWDPAPFTAGAQEIVAARGAEWITPNEIEARAMLSLPDDGSAAPDPRRLCDLGFAGSIITLGERGAVAAHRDWSETLEIAAPEVGAVDTTGAGDAFAGAFAAALSLGIVVPEALAMAVDYASRSVTVRGVQNSFPGAP